MGEKAVVVKVDASDGLADDSGDWDTGNWGFEWKIINDGTMEDLWLVAELAKRFVNTSRDKSLPKIVPYWCSNKNF